MDKLNFKLTQEEADLIVKSLGELPYRTSAQLIANLQLQYQAQTAKSGTEKSPKSVKKENT